MTDTPGSAPDPASTPPTSPAARALTRRRFLRLTVPAVLIAAAASGLARWTDWRGAGARLRRTVRRAEESARAYQDARRAPADRIVRHFDYLRLDRAGVERFVSDYTRAFGNARPRTRAANRLFYTKFLMSTDFFVNGADESKPVRYVALHDPYASPCWRPFPPAEV